MLFNEICAAMLNNRAKKDSQKVLEALGIHAGDSIADIGSGGGYFTLELAKRVGTSGIVFAADTNKKLLARIENILRKSRISNVKTVVCSEDGCPLRNKSCDLIFMRNVFHHIKDPVSYFTRLGESVKPGGRIAIVEWKHTGRGFVGRTGHATPEAEILKIMLKAEFAHLQAFNFLPDQSFHIFRKNA